MRASGYSSVGMWRYMRWMPIRPGPVKRLKIRLLGPPSRPVRTSTCFPGARLRWKTRPRGKTPRCHAKRGHWSVIRSRSRRHSSAVEQLFRKQQVLGSNPSVGSSLRVTQPPLAIWQTAHAQSASWTSNRARARAHRRAQQSETIGEQRSRTIASHSVTRWTRFRNANGVDDLG